MSKRWKKKRKKKEMYKTIRDYIQSIMLSISILKSGSLTFSYRIIKNVTVPNKCIAISKDTVPFNSNI